MSVAKNLPNDFESLWMPFSANKHFKSNPRLLSRAKGMYYFTPSGEKILDGVAGLWCCNAGHNRDEIVKAIKDQAEEMDFAPAFNMGHPKSFQLSSKLSQISPEGFNHVFFGNSGSEAVESALKIALAYWREKGKEEKKIIIGRNRGYHGTNFGGVSVGGIEKNRTQFNKFLPDIYHLPDTHNIKKNAFSKGQPEHGQDLALKLNDFIHEHGADKIAAVIVEPVAGSTGVLIPPKGYLEKLKEICNQNDILLIFDEVITGFGRTGKAFASQFFNVIPDLICVAKGINSGTVPMGAVLVKDKIYDAFMHKDEKSIDLFHGYTYSAHPLACAASLAAIELYKKEGLFERALELSSYWQEAIHSLKGVRNVIDIRNLGLIGAIELEPIKDKPALRAYNVLCEAFNNQKTLLRVTGDIVALSPPLIIEKNQIDQLIENIKITLEKTE
ncbi:MAG: aspartate aminotransferase family protein [Pelagibacteraceae bacterium]